MSVPNPWTRHYQIGWENRAANTATPLWARVVSLAYGRHEANGHANFPRGELSWILGTPPKDGQPFKRRHRDSVRDAIAVAVKYGWLADGSCSECLIVPSHEIEGPMGNASKPCPVHERKNAQKRTTRPRLAAVS
jgi:hypothetical protein